jgi:hypothetical protein
MPILKLHAKLSVREGLDNIALNLDCFFLWHTLNAFKLLNKGVN